MSCEIKPFARIDINENIRQFFGFSSDVNNWLNLCFVSISPTKEILTLGHETKFVILGCRYLESEQIINYTINWQGHIENENETITSILCMPVIGQLSPQEWTCIAIGLTSGLVLFYTDSGEQIFSQQWHNGESVQELRAQSGKKVAEEFYITYASCVCIVQGSHLFDVLKNMKQYYFKVHNNSSKFDISPTSDRIPCRKWAYGVKQNMKVNDSIVIGSEKSLTFDHLLTASLEGGFFAKYRSAPPQNYLVLAIGMNPFLGFHYGKDGFIQPVLADVARAVASKLKSALPNWLTGTQVTEAEIPSPITPSEPMICRFGLCDQQRNSMSVWLAPGNKIAAVSDNLGRIILVDCIKGIAIRVWKGYREAQCSFIEVIEKVAKKSNDKSDKRKAIFLVIFAPRRSCLEIWPLQRGDKIAAFNASKYGKLLYTSYSFMGVTSGTKPKYTTNTCLFFDPSDQSIKEIIIPFHCALTDANSKTAKDLHLLRRCKMLLRSSDDGTEEEMISEISTTCKSFETNEIRLQCLDMLVKNIKIKPATLRIALRVLLEEISKIDEGDELLDYELSQNYKNILRTLCTNYIKLIDFYLYVTTSDDHEAEDKVYEMDISKNELMNIQQLLDLSTLEGSNSLTVPRVKFSDLNEKSTNFIDYLSAFNVHKSEINLHEDKCNLFYSVGLLIYQKFFEKNKNLSRFCDLATNSGIIIDDFMKLLLFYWLEKPFSYSTSEQLIEDMSRFSLILHNICALAGDKVEFEYSTISNWWQSYREILLESPCALRGLLAAIICRDQAVKFGITEIKEENGLSNQWETVSQEKCEWTLLISKLDDVAVLGAILSVPKFENNALPILNYEKPNISLKEILKGGKGIISEMVSKWISAIGISPEKLLEKELDVVVATTSSDDKKIKNLENYPLSSKELLKNDDKTINVSLDKNLDFDPVLHNLNILRDHFPFSLKSSVLLCHLTWEYMCHWSKNLSDLEYLKAGLNCLEVFKKQDFGIKHGLCCMLWNAHFKIPLEATKKLINKAGRLPKEKLCLQDIGLSDHCTPLFLEYCQVFLEHFSTSLDHEKVDLKFEELLQDGPIPLALLTLQQNLANPILLNLHMDLVEILYFIAFFNLKYQKPVQNLFNGLSNQTFFTEINKNLNYVIPEPDLILHKIRFEFFEKLITASIDLIREDFENVFLNDHIYWIEKIERFACKWNMDLMALKRHQIIELYSHNCDNYAEELLDSIIETQDFGSLLLKIAGRRLNTLTKNSPSTWSTVAAIGPLLSDYLDNLNVSDSNQIQYEISLDALLKLVGKAFSCLSGKDTKELRIAGQLFDACATIKEM